MFSQTFNWDNVPPIYQKLAVSPKASKRKKKKKKDPNYYFLNKANLSYKFEKKKKKKKKKINFIFILEKENFLNFHSLVFFIFFLILSFSFFL
jgi:hypothetical protein